MSRAEFREPVTTPRSSGAILTVALGSLCLIITGQISLWSMFAQGATLIYATLSRRSPMHWQENPWLLNGVLASIVILSVGIVAQGESILIALAYFALHTQGLQLLDARPRYSEFPLVTLALFQVLLASNLTDSLMFPPVVAAFLLSIVWTLLVHTLEAEAMESNDPLAASQVTTPRLFGMTIFVSLAAICFALILFVVLPRLQLGLARNLPNRPTLSAAGFSQRIELGALGRIRQDSSVVLRVETLKGKRPPRMLSYWRGLAFDHFDGKSWSISSPDRASISGFAETAFNVKPAGESHNLTQRITREPMSGGVLFSLGTPVRIESDVRSIDQDANGGLRALEDRGGRATHSDRITYTVSSQFEMRNDSALVDDRASPPSGESKNLLQLPMLHDFVQELAEEITAGQPSDFERARAIEEYLLQEGRYSDTPPSLAQGDERTEFSPVEQFLKSDLEGHCEYFASAMVVLARSANLPARLVNGFTGGEFNEFGDYIEIRRLDAHAWVEIPFEQAGWVRFDPTPPDLRMRSQGGLPSTLARLRELRDAIELWWFRDFVEFSQNDQMRAARKAHRLWWSWRTRSKLVDVDEMPTGGTEVSVPWAPIVLPGLAALLIGCAFWLRRRTRGGSAPSTYARALVLLARHGIHRDPWVTPRRFAIEAGNALPRPAAAAFWQLTESYLAERYGGHTALSLRDELRVLRDSLRP